MDAEPPRIDAALVRRLVDDQFPHWAHLPVRPVAVDGWDNRTFHLGDELTVRLPSAAGYAAQVDKEHRWLPVLAPKLPLPIPAPEARGRPGHGYPYPWSVYRWVEGETAAADRIADLTGFAADLADFLTALRRADATGGPPPGPHNFFRGAPPGVYDGETRAAIAELGDAIPARRVLAVWETALGSTWQGAPVWFHGDIAHGNLLVRDGRLAAVIDFGTCGVGDPACDTVISWHLFTGESRAAYQKGLDLDAETWARGRGWALWKALIMYAALRHSDPTAAAPWQRVIDEVLADS